MGVTNTWQCGATLFAIDEDLILRTWKWYVDLLQKDPGLARSTYVLVEVMQKVSSLYLLVTWEVRSCSHKFRRRTNLWAIPARKLPGHIRGTNIISSWVQVECLDPGKETPWVDRQW
jgi:hypothetical protein